MREARDSQKRLSLVVGVTSLGRFLFSSTRALMLLASLPFLIDSQTSAQVGCELYVSVRNSKGQPVRASFLLIGSGLFSRTADADDTGQGTFLGLPEDDYRLVIRLANGEQTEETVSTRNGACLQFATVRFGGLNELVRASQIFAGDLKAPHKAQKLYKQGVSQIHRQHWRDAQRLLEKSVDVYPKFSGAYNALGVAATENADFGVANAAFRRAIRIRKNYSEAYINFAIALNRQKSFRDSELLLNELFSFDQDNRAAVTIFSRCLFEQQKFDEVLDLVHEVHLKHRAHDPALHRCAFEIYMLRGMMQESSREAAVMAAESGNHR